MLWSPVKLLFIHPSPSTSVTSYSPPVAGGTVELLPEKGIGAQATSCAVRAGDRGSSKLPARGLVNLSAQIRRRACVEHS
jgi:hypothetical protein